MLCLWMLRGNSLLSAPSSTKQGSASRVFVFLSGLGCRYGILCEFCHVKYDRRHRRKMCQRKRESFKRAQDDHQAPQMKNDLNDASLAFEEHRQGGYILISV
mmetsp:Transcript_96934/g.260690  ORF Transcript_96934/g.260690 Transcript_96934/m.260690 type:complete len:102 (+) Transcript_96934:303-608(+)